MAWTVSQKLQNRWAVAAITDEESRELLRRRNRYRDENPTLFPARVPLTSQGVHLPLDLFPKKARIPVSMREPPDFLTMAGYGVSERVKNLFERLEPGVHQFVEVPTSLRGGDPTPQRYYAMALGQIAYHQVDDELTTIWRDANGMIEPPDHTYRRGRIAINRDKTAGWHAWYSKDIYNNLTISDELHALFLSEKIPGLTYVHLLERGTGEGEAA